MFSKKRPRRGGRSKGPSGSESRKSRSSTPVRVSQRVGRYPTPSRPLHPLANGGEGEPGHGEPSSVADADMAKALTQVEVPAISPEKRKSR
eukprot:4512042-Lingulodinium_polyedra.AAC.1